MEEKNTTPVKPTPATQPIPPTPSTENKKSKKKLVFIICGIILLLILIGIGTFYYLKTQKNKSLALDKIENTETTASPTPTKIPTFSSSLPKVYKTRYFDITEDFAPENEKYPTELIQIPEESLTPIYCTPNYTKWGEKYTWNDETNKTITLDDPETLNYIKTLEEKYKSEKRIVNEILSCKPKEGKTIILYSLGPCGGGCSGISHIGISDDSDIKELANISKLEVLLMPYFGCRQPLQFTKNNMFYFLCGGGDGPGSATSLYKLSLDTEQVSRIKSCSTYGTEDGKSKTECK